MVDNVNNSRKKKNLGPVIAILIIVVILILFIILGNVFFGSHKNETDGRIHHEGKYVAEINITRKSLGSIISSPRCAQAALSKSAWTAPVAMPHHGSLRPLADSPVPVLQLMSCWRALRLSPRI